VGEGKLGDLEGGRRRLLFRVPLLFKLNRKQFKQAAPTGTEAVKPEPKKFIQQGAASEGEASNTAAHITTALF
jgi:hypothetical protein